MHSFAAFLLYFLAALRPNSRGDRRLTFPNDVMGSELLGRAIAQTHEFTADTFFALGCDVAQG